MHFDKPVYKQILGLRADEPLRTLYDLLGVAPFEAREEVLNQALAARVAQARRYQVGEYQAQALELLNELSRAFLTLTNDELRKQYDASLRGFVAGQLPAAAVSLAPHSVPAKSLPANSAPPVEVQGPQLPSSLPGAFEGGEAELQASPLLARYSARLVRLAEQHLSHRLAARLDGDDVVQSAFRTFFRRSARGDFHIDDSADLWRLLVRITLMKARAAARHHTAAMRDARAEAAGEAGAWLSAALARDPDPADAVALVDQIEGLLEGLPELYAQVLRMRLEGRSVAEIATQLGLSRQTIYRALQLLKERLADEDLQGEGQKTDREL